MSVDSDIYGLESVVEGAVKAVFTDRNIKAFTTLDIFDFQKDRPRVEVEYINGPGQGIWRPVTLADGTKCICESAWKGQIKLGLITEATPTVHNAFRVAIRSLMNRIGPLVNSVAPMTLHTIQPFFLDGGTATDWTPQEGCYRTTMMFNIDLSVQANAWAALT